MLIANKSKQRKFFDNARYRFPTLKIFNPLLQHRLELLHIKKHLTIDPPKNICDFGSGSGRLTIPLLQMGFHVHAVDISVQSLHALKKAYESNKTKSWGKLTLSSTLPENTLFDAIFGSDILHHVTIPSVLNKFYRALKPGGLLIFSEPNAWHFFWYVYYLIFVSWEIEKGIINCTIANLQKEFTKAGFHNFRIEGHGLLPTPLFNFLPNLSSFNVWLGNRPILKKVAFRFIISAKK